MSSGRRAEQGSRMSNGIVGLLLSGLLVGCGSNGDSSEQSWDRAFESLTGANVRNHIEILAADDMQGREAGTAGHRKAAEYVASRFSELGLKPLGDNDTYFQNINFLESRLVEESATIVLHKEDADTVLHYGEDFVRYGGFGRADETVTAPLVFVGFGIQAPGYKHDDFAGVDVGGKILVELTGAPSSFASDERAFYSSGEGKQALAVELGAVGIITIRTPVDQQRLTWPRMLGLAKAADMRWIGADNKAQGGFPELTGNAVLSNSGAERLFGLAGRSLDELFERHSNGDTGGFDLDVSATLERRSTQRRASSPNVLALLPGSDPALRNEYVLFTAHLDHLGIRRGENGTEIYSGAYDNAAGVAIVVEMAGALSKVSPAPRRSIIFAAVTAEEKGLRGSDYLAHNPPVAIGNIVANINIDMPYLGYPIADVEGFGVEHSTLHGALIRATEQQKLALTPDPHPELVRLIRSDQFSFVKQGVPGLNLKPGSISSDPAIGGAELQSAFLQDHYHGPSDDLNLPFSEDGAQRFARMVLAFGLIVANDNERPRWKDGDFFGDLFAGDDPK
jgi:hypothetical protein